MLLGFYLLLIVLHIIEGCNLENHKKTEKINAQVGDAVLLPCTCSNLQNTPRNLTWKKYNKNNDWDFIATNQKRFQLSNVQEISPGNLSLLILKLTVEDEGLYRCQIRGEEYTDIIITVTGVKDTEPPKLPISTYLSFIPVVLLLGIGGVIFWRYRVKKREQTPSNTGPTEQKREQETQDDVIMYTTVVHTNTPQRPKALSTNERTEYAVIKLH
ncbi:uncharacterized protein LOC131354656 [Hemibagrus wyckioides]|uniref:uncharacterized protein LOC131354656 n=1 Tax=Hemibagrus wyckioides TaxID=337641 RepID=UPI00266C993D|nr:uncharacterized protein LOC131354656 [Hemibagrus wyckioides]